jgi:hypothetical protein
VRRAAFAATTLAFAIGCTGSSGNDAGAPDATPACAATLPKTCPQSPSYAKDIAPLVKRVCGPCHSQGGIASDRDLTTYANLTKLETTVLVQVNSCSMPPPDAGPESTLTSDERTELLQWLVCGAPNN